MVFFIIMSATVFGHFMAISNILLILADWIGGLLVSPIAVMAIIIIIYLFGGFFLVVFSLGIAAYLPSCVSY